MARRVSRPGRKQAASSEASEDASRLTAMGVKTDAHGLQRLLCLAAVDERFQAELVAQRDLAAAAAGIQLSPNETAILRALPQAQLVAMARRLPLPASPRRSFLRQTAATAVVLLGGAALSIESGGCRPAEAPPTEPPEADAGLTEDEAARREWLLKRAKEREAEEAEDPLPWAPRSGDDSYGYGYEFADDPLSAGGGGHAPDIPPPKKKKKKPE